MLVTRLLVTSCMPLAQSSHLEQASGRPSTVEALLVVSAMLTQWTIEMRRSAAINYLQTQ